MFVSAKMITITNCNPSEYIKQLDAFTLDVSIIGLVACLWVILVFILTKKIFRIPHKITACLVTSQVPFFTYFVLIDLSVFFTKYEH